jgi:hypothetical protein
MPSLPGEITVRRLALLPLILLLAACGTNNAPLPEPLPILEAAAVHINNAESFRLEIFQEGAPYNIESDVIDGELLFDRARMDYVAPDVLQGQIRAQLMRLPFEFGIMARGEYQWVRLPGAGWTDTLYFAPGFNPQTLIAEDSGFQAALGALLDIEMIGRENLEDGTAVYHMRGMADGPKVSELLVYIITTEDPVIIDAYIGVDDNLPVRLAVTIPGTETETEPDPTQFVIDLYDFNGVDTDVDITGPSYDDPAEADPEVTPLLEQETPAVTEEATDAPE